MNQVNRIPRVLHQTYKDNNIPNNLRVLQKSWLKHNPDWQYRFWSDEDIRGFVVEHFADFLDTFDAYPHNIMRVDAFRYLLLYHHGGIYADLDFECLKPMDDLLGQQDIFLIPEPDEHLNKHKTQVRNLDYVASNAFMASMPGHPFWQKVIELLKTNSNNPDVLDATGPFMLTYAHNSFSPTIPLANPHHFDGLLSDDQGKVAGKAQYNIDKNDRDESVVIKQDVPLYARHHWAGTWWKRPPMLQILAKLVRSMQYSLLQRLSYNYKIRDHVKSNEGLYKGLATGKNCLPKSCQIMTLVKGKIIGEETYNLNTSHITKEIDLPLISALLVTKDRPELAWRAVECFMEQSYPNKELVIIDEGGYEFQKKLQKEGLLQSSATTSPTIHIPPPMISYHRNEEKTTLGALRNRAIGLAQGEYICQWDDDDLYHRHRLSYQLDACIKNNAAASFLLRQMLWNLAGGNLAISGYRLWEGTILVKKELMFKYAKWVRGEDSVPVYFLASKRKLVALDLPELYMYHIHGDNTWDKKHMSNIWNGATRHFNLEQDRADKLTSLANDYPHLNSINPLQTHIKEHKKYK